MRCDAAAAGIPTGDTMRPRIVVVGSSNTDMIVQVDRIPAPGQTVLGGRFSTAPGGKGANQAVAAARAGADVTFVARVGSDAFGRESLAGFVRDSINTQFIVCDEAAPSGVASIIVDEQGENAIAVAPGANANLSLQDIAQASKAISAADVVLLQLEIPIKTVREGIRTAWDHDVPVILNPAPACELTDELLGCVSVLTPNEIEASMLTGIEVHDESDAIRVAALLRRRGVRTVIVTLGPRGAVIDGPDYQGPVEPFVVEAVDTTAAGDVFNGVLAVALAEGRPLPEACRWASAAAALSVQHLGAQPSAPGRTVIEQFVAEHQ